MSRTNGKKWVVGRGSRVIDFEIRLWIHHRRTNRSVEVSIFAASFVVSSRDLSYFQNHNGTRMRARLDILILFIDKAVFVMSLLRARRVKFGRIALPFRVSKSRQEQATHNHRGLQCALINRDVLGVVTINRLRNVALINRRQVTRIAHYYSRINMFHRYNVY